MPFWGQVDLASAGSQQVAIRFTNFAFPALSIGASTDVAVTWPAAQGALPGSAYDAQVSVEGASALLGSVTAQVKQGTKTASGCTITVKNTGLLAITLGNGTVFVLAYMSTT